MPATEKTYYNMRRLHVVFATSSILLVVVTIWVLARDHFRSWKEIQRKTDHIEIRLAEWKKLQVRNETMVTERERLRERLAELLSRPFPEETLRAFRCQVRADAQRRHVPMPSFEKLDQATLQFEKAGEKAAEASDVWYQRQLETDKARLEAEDAAMSGDESEDKKGDPQRRETYESVSSVKQAERRVEQAEREMERVQAAVVPRRERVLHELESFIRQAKFRQARWERERRDELAKLDVKKARRGLAIRDGARDTVVKRLQDDIERQKQKVREITRSADAAKAHRQRLQSLFSDLTEPVESIRKRIDRIDAKSERLDGLVAKRRSTYFNYWGFLPVPGKKWLELPFLDAFNSPRKIENLWSKGLDRPAGSFGRVPRFDRCTTCHQRLDKTLSDAVDESVASRPVTIDFALQVPDAAATETRGNRAGDSERLASVFGLALAERGLVDQGEVTVRFVNASAPAARARRWQPIADEMKAEQIRLQFWRAAVTEYKPYDTGLRLGDVIVAVDGDPVPGGAAGRQWVTDRLLSAATNRDDTPRLLRVTVRRGLPHPYAEHPRLHLFVDEDSPHKASTFGCTVCHAGQGSATSFKWASHTPNNPRSRRRWRAEHAWFDNPHWKSPMHPRQFMECSCLKCHHDVVELEENSEFRSAPAPKLAKGYRLIRTLGCFGCHEIRGHDSANRRIGPDLRLEPNYHAAALQLKGSAGSGYGRLTAAEQETVNQLVDSPEDDSLRKKVFQLLRTEAGKASENPDAVDSVEQGGGSNNENEALDETHLSENIVRKLLPLLEPVETPGSLRKVGPSLRCVSHKLSADYLREWIWKPRQVRPSTRMPHSFNLWNHLPAKQLRARRIDLQRELERSEDASSANIRSFDEIEADLAAVNEELVRIDEMEKRFEPIAVHAMVRYLLERSQAYDFVQPPSGVTPVVTEQDKQAQIERGSIAFQELGCLACHNHADFPNIDQYRDPDDLVPGPDLSDLASKFSDSPNSGGAKWLYSWLAKPSRYTARTIMPETMADPVKHRDADGDMIAVTDPLADLVAYLLSGSDKVRSRSGNLARRLDEKGRAALFELTLTYVKDTFPEATAREYSRTGIPSSRRDRLEGAERELLVSADEKGGVSANEMTRKRLFYVARESFMTSGCCGCHDIPGMEDAQPIGPDLNDWGRKNTTELAFGHVARFVRRERARETRGQTAAESAGPAREPNSQRVAADTLDMRANEEGRARADKQAVNSGSNRVEEVWSPEQYLQQLELKTRIGFLHQKLSQPRSFDYKRVRNKKYTDRLRMPKFSLTAVEREAIMTFVLGLVANPPRREYVYSPSPDKKAIFQGDEILTKYSCLGCHMLDSERWELEFPPGTFREQPHAVTYPFVEPRFSVEQRERSRRVDQRGLRHATVSGMPVLSADGLPLILDDLEFPIEEEPDEIFNVNQLIYPFDLWRPALVDGHPYRAGDGALDVFAANLKSRKPSYGGALAKYLLPRVVEREKERNPNAQGSQAWGWLPPCLADEGLKVQPDWLHEYLLNPYPIRPAMVMQMPRYNISSREAAKLVDRFAAKNDVAYPFSEEPTRREEHLRAADRAYTEKFQHLELAATLKPSDSPGGRHLSDAMKLLADRRYCVTCHVMGDYEPPGSERVKAPDLAAVHERLRSDYVRKWIAQPTTVQPYTPMPINIPYVPDAPLQGSTVPQELYHGNSTEQLDALVDLLMNYDRYSRGKLSVTSRVREQANGEP